MPLSALDSHHGRPHDDEHAFATHTELRRPHIGKLYSKFDPIGTFLSNWRTRMVTRYIRDGQVIDLACGDNRLIRNLGRGVGVDIKDYGADRVCEDFTKLPFEDDSVDSVTIMAALNYFDNPSGVMTELSRIIKPDGNVLVTLLNKRVSNLWHKLRDRKLVRVAYSEDELKDILANTPLRLVRKHSFMLGLNWLYIIEQDPESQR